MSSSPAHCLIASKRFPFVSCLAFPLWHVYATIWLIPPANAFSHSLQSKKVMILMLDNSMRFGAVVPDNIYKLGARNNCPIQSYCGIPLRHSHRFIFF